MGEQKDNDILGKELRKEIALFVLQHDEAGFGSSKDFVRKAVRTALDTCKEKYGN